MKRTFIFTALILSLSCAACQQTSNVNTNSTANHGSMNHAQMNHSAMNHQTTNANQANTASNVAMNHDGMNHDAMNHSEMKSSPDADKARYDLQFLDTMIAHHQGAVDMARMIDGKTDNAELKKFGVKIVADQEKEIGQMREWRGKWFAGKPAAMNMEMAGMKDSMKGMDMTKLAAARGADFDRMFIEMMIPHHVGAVEMAKEAINKAEHQEIKTLAQAIIMAQESEIKTMRDWQEKRAK